MLMIRPTPVTSTRARCSCSSSISTQLAGDAEAHGRRLLLVFDRDDLDPDVDLGLDLQHQDPRAAPSRSRGCRSATAPSSRIVCSSTCAMAISSSWCRVTPRNVTSPAHPVAAVLAVRHHGVEVAVDAWGSAGRRCARCSSRSSSRLPDVSRSTANDKLADRRRRPGRRRPPARASSSTKPSRPSVSEWIGCTLERASIHTVERSGTMRSGPRAVPTPVDARITSPAS